MRQRKKLQRQRMTLLFFLVALVVVAIIMTTSSKSEPPASVAYAAEKTPIPTMPPTTPLTTKGGPTSLGGEDFVTKTTLGGEDFVANFERPDTNPGGSGTTSWNNVPNENRGKNPSVDEVVQYAYANASNHSAPPEVPLTVCYWESGGLKQYGDDGELTQCDNGSSSDWGICQINDKYKSADLVAMAKSDSWQASFEAGWIVLDGCWDKYGKISIEAVLACHHAPGDVYYDIQEYGYVQRPRPMNYLKYVMPIWRGEYWNNYK